MPMNLAQISSLRSHYAISAVACAALLGCGGGGGGDSPPPTVASAEGAYWGTISGSTSNSFELIVLETGEYWALYGITVGNVLFVQGLIQGTGTSSNGAFTSTNGKDFGSFPAPTAAVNATYVAGSSVQGTFAVGTQSATFSGTSPQTTVYNYSTPASLGTIAGNWTLTTLDGTRTTLVISANGSATGVSDGCSLTGTFTPRASGKNLFNVAVTFGPAPCELPNQTATGIGVTSTPSGTTSRQLIVGLVNASRANGDVGFGTR